MSLSKLRRQLYRTNRTFGDINAVTRGRVGSRLANRVLGRLLGS